MSITQIEEQIFTVHPENFESLALEIFKYQSASIRVYKKYIETLKIDIDQVRSLQQIPFLPIQFFKTQRVMDSQPAGDTTLFESSGTTGQLTSKHYVKDVRIYERSFTNCFRHFFREEKNYCILGLLPSYLERKHSSLVYMVNSLIEKSGHPSSGFYLHNHEELYKTIIELEKKKQPSILIGVTYALLDFAEKYKMNLNYTKLIETGGMKGRREELTRDEVHALLKDAFSIQDIYSEYGMTELLSQAYSLKDGIFYSPAWMRICVRDMNDPFEIKQKGKGILNCIDLANLHSCSFIATDDMGKVFEDASFVVNGRVDHTDLRGCGLMII